MIDPTSTPDPESARNGPRIDGDPEATRETGRARPPTSGPLDPRFTPQRPRADPRSAPRPPRLDHKAALPPHSTPRLSRIDLETTQIGPTSTLRIDRATPVLESTTDRRQTDHG